MKTIKTKEMTTRITERVRRRGKEDLKKILMREIIYVVVERVIYPMLPFTLMLRLNIKVFFLKEQLTFKRKGNKVLVQIVGK